MKITIITATYNSAQTISKCISSICNQGHKDVEHIIIDGISNDGTLDIIKSQSNSIIKLFSESDNGIYDALNKGIKASTGDIIGFVHSDDFLASPEILENISKLIEEENVDGVYGDLVYVDKEDTTKVIRYWKSNEFKSSLLYKGWMPAHPTLFLKKEVYEKHGYFNLNYKIAADYDFVLRIFGDNALKFKYLPIIITKMRTGGISNGGIKNIFLKTCEDYASLKANNISNPLLALLKKNSSKLSQFFITKKFINCFFY